MWFKSAGVIILYTLIYNLLELYFRIYLGIIACFITNFEVIFKVWYYVLHVGNSRSSSWAKAHFLKFILPSTNVNWSLFQNVNIHFSPSPTPRYFQKQNSKIKLLPFITVFSLRIRFCCLVS